MALLEAEWRAARFRRDVLVGPSGHFADPQRPHPLEAGQPLRLVGAPLAKLIVLGELADRSVLDDCITEVIDHRSDGKHATKAVVEAGLRHGSCSSRFR